MPPLPLTTGLAKPRIGVVIVNWNGGDLLFECARSLMASTYGPATVIVVDNQSQDGSERRLLAEFPGFRLIRNRTNLGFAAAANQGIRAALERGVDFVFLLNNDARLKEDALENLVLAAERHNEGGLFAGKILTSDGKKLWCAGLATGFFPNLQDLRGFGEDDRGQFEKEEVVDGLTGCGLLIRRRTLERVGLLDEDFFVYVEDFDFALRAAKEQELCYYVPGSIMYHAPSSSSGGGYGAWRKYMTAYNLLLLLRKHPRVKFWAAFVIFEIFLWPLALLVGACRGRFRATAAKMCGYLDSLSGRPPRRPLAKTSNS